jgi:predicted DNA-binding transcriptional regulator AlpA
MFNKAFVEAGEIAEALGWSRPWFRRRLKSLIVDHAFPSPLPSGRWHAETVANWIRGYGDKATMARQQAEATRKLISEDALKLVAAFGRAA